MSEAKDYGEPWEHEGYRVWRKGPHLVAEVWGNNDPATARIVACVNACAGIEHPEAAIRTARIVLDGCEATLRPTARSSEIDKAFYLEVAAALALLAPERKETT